MRKYEAVSLRTAYLITVDAPEAEDAVQEAFVKAYRALERFRPGAPFKPWLLAIVANEARNRRKAAGRRARLSLRAVADVRTQSAPSSPEAAVVEAEQRAELLRAVEELREEDRQAIACRYFLGLSEQETAVVLNCKRGTVKSRLSRAIGRLREKMMEAEDGLG